MQKLKNKPLLIVLILYHLTVLLWVYCMESKAAPGEFPLPSEIELPDAPFCPVDEFPYPAVVMTSGGAGVPQVTLDGVAPDLSTLPAGLCCHKVPVSPRAVP